MSTGEHTRGARPWLLRLVSECHECMMLEFAGNITLPPPERNQKDRLKKNVTLDSLVCGIFLHARWTVRVSRISEICTGNQTNPAVPAQKVVMFEQKVLRGMQGYIQGRGPDWPKAALLLGRGFSVLENYLTLRQDYFAPS